MDKRLRDLQADYTSLQSVHESLEEKYSTALNESCKLTSALQESREGLGVVKTESEVARAAAEKARLDKEEAEEREQKLARLLEQIQSECHLSKEVSHEIM